MKEYRCDMTGVPVRRDRSTGTTVVCGHIFRHMFLVSAEARNDTVPHTNQKLPPTVSTKRELARGWIHMYQ